MRSYGPTSKPLRSPVTHPIRKRAVRPGVVQNRTQTPQPFGTPHRVLPNADISEIGLRTQRPPSLQAGRPFKGRGVAGWSFTRCRSQSLQKKQLERTTRKWVYTLSLKQSCLRGVRQLFGIRISWSSKRPCHLLPWFFQGVYSATHGSSPSIRLHLTNSPPPASAEQLNCSLFSEGHSEPSA